MYAKIFTGSAFLLSFVSVSMAGAPWDANDKALGHQGGTSHYARQSQYNQYRYQPLRGTGKSRSDGTSNSITGDHCCKAASPGSADTEIWKGGVVFQLSLRPPCLKLSRKFLHPRWCHQEFISPAPRATHGTARPSWESADTKIRGLEGSVKHN